MHNLRIHYEKVTKTLKYFFRIVKILASAGNIYLFAIVALAIVFGVVPSISILVMREIVNALQEGSHNLDHIILLIIIYIAIDLLNSMAALISGYVENILKMKASITLNLSVLEKVKEFSLKDFENSDVYDLIQRAKDIGIDQIFSFFKSFILVFQAIISLVAFSIVLVSWKWWLLPIIFIFPLLSSFVAAYFGKKQFLIQKERTGDERKRWYFQFLLTNDIAFKEINIFNIGDYFRSKYKQISSCFLGQDRKLLNQSTGVRSLLLVLDQIISALLFLYIILCTFSGELLLGDMITYIRSISNIKTSTQGFLSQMNTIYQSVLYISLYFDFIDMKTKAKPEKYDHTIKLSDLPFINIKNLSYRYKGQKSDTLKNLNLRIEKNRIVALIGKNGSGKTTLIKILSSLYDDYQGDVYFGDVNLRKIDADEVRKKIGILFQDFVRYELSVRENVALGQIEQVDNDSAIFQALFKTGMQDKTTDLETQLGFWFKNGVQISGGEWLKIALSRAFIRDAELYLLDEPNSALDAVSERQVFKSFKKLCEGKIGIIVSHRISSIKDIVDQIIVFDNGSIQAIGTHDELLRSSDIYLEMYHSEEGMDETLVAMDT